MKATLLGEFKDLEQIVLRTSVKFQYFYPISKLNKKNIEKYYSMNLSLCIEFSSKHPEMLENSQTLLNNRQNSTTGFIIAFCFVLTQCNEDDLTKSENEVKCPQQVQAKPQKDDKFHRHYHHSDEDFDDDSGFFGRSLTRESARKTNYCVNIPKRSNRDSGSHAITEFAWKLFKSSNNQANYVLSPLNPQIILSYVAWIADGKTRNELVSAIGYGSPTNIHRTIDSVLRDDSKRELQFATAFFVASNIV